MKKKVLILLARDPVTEVRVFHLTAKTLVSAGHDVTIVAPRYRNDAPSGELDGVKFVTYKKSSNRFLRKFHTLFTLTRFALKSKADVFQVFEVDAPLMAAVYAKRIHVRRGRTVNIVFDNTEIWPFFYASRSRLKLLHTLIIGSVFVYEWIMVRKYVDGLIAAHELEANYYRWIDTHLPIRLGHAGLDIDDEVPAKQSTEGKRYIGYDGYVTLRNGLAIMLDAFDLVAPDFPDAHLLLSGDFLTFEDKSFFEEWQKISKFSDRVEWTGWVERDAQIQNLDRFEIALAPYKDDIHTDRIWPPNKIVNYMSRKVPFISTLSSQFQRQKIEETGGGIAARANTPEALADAIRQLLSDPESSRLMGQLGYEFAKKHFNVATTRKNLIALYKDLD